MVWLKHTLPTAAEGPSAGDLTPDSKALIEDFVYWKFVDWLKEKGIPDAEDRIQWFKNWKSLQSVRAIEHFHVLGRDIPQEVILEWTGGVRALADEDNSDEA